MALLAAPRRADVLDEMVHYLVDTTDGSVGILDDWERDENRRPKSLIIAQGWFGRRRLAIPVETLLEIDHERRRVLLAPCAAPLEPKGLLERLMELGQTWSAKQAPVGMPREPEHIAPVLCAVSHGPHATTIVAVAAQLARKLSVPLVLTHVAPADADGSIDLLLSPLVFGTDVRRVITKGDPARTLDQLARREGAQLLVIGSVGKGALGVVPWDSVSHRLAQLTPCPIVVVPSDPTSLRRDEDAPDEHWSAQVRKP